MKLASFITISLITLSLLSLASAFDFPHTIVNIDYSGNLTNFTELQDTPSTYTGSALKFLRVNSGGTGLEFTTVSGITDTNASTACTGTQYLAGNGSCLEPSAIGGDTNETTRFNALVNTDCGAGYLVIGVQSNGTVLCAADATGGAGGGNTSEEMQDAVLGGANITINYDDTNNAWGVNITWLTSWINTWLGTKTTDDLTQGSTNLYDNSSWNQSLANTLYSPIGVSGDNSSWNESYADTLYAPINYGDEWNKTYADTLYADISVTGDNSSWNESYADTLYAPIGVTGDNSSWNESYADTKYLQSYTETDPLWSANFTAYNTSWSTDTDTLYYNSTGLALNGSNFFSILLSYQMPQGCNDGEIAEYNTTSGGWDCAIDNSAASGMSNWILAAEGVGGSEAITDGETVTFGTDDNYIEVSRSTNNIGYSINETYLNQTIDDRDSDTTYSSNLNFTNDANYWNDTYATFNKSYADTLYASISVTGDNSSWNESYADTKYLTSYTDTNASTACAGTTTYLDGEGNCDDISSVYAPVGYGDEWNKTYADTLYASISVTGDNSSWNESYANTLYADISITGDNSSWNQTLADTLYADISVVDTDTHLSADADKYLYNDSTTISFNETELNNSIDLKMSGYALLSTILGFNYYNATDFSITDYFTKAEILGFNYWNSTWAGFNKTYADTLYASISVTGDNSSWNQSLADTLYAPINYGDEWNKTYADTLYADISVTGDNSSWNESYADTKYLTSYTETDPLWSGNISNVAFTNVEETFSGNITVEGIKFEGDSTNHVINDNSTCIFISGDTSTIEVC